MLPPARTLYQRRMSVINSPSDDNPTNSTGIVFVINKEILKAENVKIHTLILRCVIFIFFKWYNNITLSTINVYAPNDTSKHPQFWKKTEWKQMNLNLPNLDFLPGDFNLTEDPIDWAPTRPESDSAIHALRDYRHSLGIRDIWRVRFPTECTFTFTSHEHSMSRIDKIYIKEVLEESLSDWMYAVPGIPSDHKMVSIWLAHTNALFIGKNRWSRPLGLLHNKKLNEYIDIRGQRLHSEMKNLQPENRTQNV